MEENIFEYKKPKVILLSHNNLEIAELAARTAYGSYEKSSSEVIQNFPNNVNDYIDNQMIFSSTITEHIDNSDLLSNLAWVSFHHSVLEHIVLQYYISDISRGVLAELTRHRLASYTVKSTRYTLYPILLAFIISKQFKALDTNAEYIIFRELILKLDFTILKNNKLKDIEYATIFHKLYLAYMQNKEMFLNTILSKEQIYILSTFNFATKYSDYHSIFEQLVNAKQKRNSGDKFKYIVTDNFSTELVWTINLRSLKNFLTLRDSNSAWFQIRELAKQIIEVTPQKYLNLIIKEKKNETSTAE